MENEISKVFYNPKSVIFMIPKTFKIWSSIFHIIHYAILIFAGWGIALVAVSVIG